MITLSNDDFRAVIAEARLAPSVHNIQPSRWRQTNEGIELLGDLRRSIPVADPEWRDWRLSHGAALEGLSIALASRGLKIAQLDVAAPSHHAVGGQAPTIAHLTLASLDHPIAADPTASRVSWRGAFKATDAETEARLDRLAAACSSDVVLVRDTDAIDDIATLGDRAGLFFLRDVAHRKELLQWLRLSRSHPDYHRDGLNAEAMALNAFEAWGAGLVLGPLFAGLNSIGLAAPLLSESAKTKSAAAIALFHRPKDEDAFVSGRAFYRAWLEMERQGLKSCPISVLADWKVARNALVAKHGLPAGRQLVSVFRLGCPQGEPKTAHARLPVDELLVARRQY
jgi:nitroreductase